MHAQLGYLDERTGDHESAVLEFTAERELYPESAVFIDGLLRPASAALSVIATAFAGSSCASPPSEPDRTAYLAHMPRSILVLPPRTETPEADVASRWLSTITRPLAERGYYVFPVAIVDAMLRENGPKKPLADPATLFGADAVLDVDIQHWGPSENFLESELQVTLDARLVDVKTGVELWRGTSTVIQAPNDGSPGGVAGILVDALSTPIVRPAIDPTTGVARQASWALIQSPQGLLLGPRHPEFEEDQRKHRRAPPARAP